MTNDRITNDQYGGLGAISLGLSRELAAGTPLGRSVCAFIGVFWFLRLMIQLFVLDARPFLTTRFLEIGYHGLTVVYCYLAGVYLAGALLGRPY